MPTTQGTPASCKVVLAGSVAKGLLAEVSEGLKRLDRPPPHLLGILANTDPAARLYADWTEKTCQENGFIYTLREVSKDQVEETVIAANADRAIDGIIVYYPIFNNRQDQYLQQIVDVSKDVEGLSHRYIFNMYQNIRYLDDAQQQKSILPCTPLAVIKILEYLRIYNTILPYGNRLFGHTICVVNRSEVVGRPLAALLANDGACVYSVDVTGVQKFTRGEGIRKRKHEVKDMEGWGLENCLPLCDVVITGVPSKEYKFPCQLLREGAVCVNFSSEKVRYPGYGLPCQLNPPHLSRLTHLEQNFGPEVKDIASIFVPAIGKVTIVVLLRNLLRIVQNRRAGESKNAKLIEMPGTVEGPKP